ncbi:MAG: hypothetical protein HC771_22030 [Synechococcales cyanobacterium CRU_2_2]|nr:hypothetical protein [Synechococcales cyanobacterium CRU_2_2]
METFEQLLDRYARTQDPLWCLRQVVVLAAIAEELRTGRPLGALWEGSHLPEICWYRPLDTSQP